MTGQIIWIDKKDKKTWNQYYKRLEKKGIYHDPNYIFKGQKADIWDGGHHIPFLARWPEQIKPNTKTKHQFYVLSPGILTMSNILGYFTKMNTNKQFFSIVGDKYAQQICINAQTSNADNSAIT